MLLACDRSPSAFVLTVKRNFNLRVHPGEGFRTMTILTQTFNHLDRNSIRYAPSTHPVA
jgi:hypothetical protein